MECSKHSGRQAIGTCAYCHRGLCSECATDVRGMLSCPESCAADVALVAKMIHSSDRVVRAGAWLYFIFGSVVGLVGIILLAAAIIEGDGADIFAASLTLIVAFACFWCGWRFMGRRGS